MHNICSKDESLLGFIYLFFFFWVYLYIGWCTVRTLLQGLLRWAYIFSNCVFVLVPQLILTTSPGFKLDKPPSIVTEDNIQLLFEVQKKVLFVTYYFSNAILICEQNWDIHNLNWFIYSVTSLGTYEIDNQLAFLCSCWQVDKIRANYSGSLISISDICLKPLGEDCATQSVLQVV